MASFMAPAPRAFFCYFEPAIVTLGGLQIPDRVRPGKLLTRAALIHASPRGGGDGAAGHRVVWQLHAPRGAMIAVVMWRCRDPEAEVVRPVGAALLLTDVGIWMSAMRIMGWERFVDAGSWSGKLTQLFSGMLVTVPIKSANLMGWLGADRLPGDARTKRSS